MKSLPLLRRLLLLHLLLPQQHPHLHVLHPLLHLLHPLLHLWSARETAPAVKSAAQPASAPVSAASAPAPAPAPISAPTPEPTPVPVPVPQPAVVPLKVEPKLPVVPSTPASAPSSAQKETAPQKEAAPQPKPAPERAKEIQLIIKEIKFTGVTLVSEKELSKAVSEFIGKELTVEQAFAIPAKITNYYKRNNHMAIATLSGAMTPDGRLDPRRRRNANDAIASRKRTRNPCAQNRSIKRHCTHRGAHASVNAIANSSKSIRTRECLF